MEIKVTKVEFSNTFIENDKKAINMTKFLKMYTYIIPPKRATILL